MSNMSYCRFENTLSDLQDCFENMDADLEKDSREWRAREELIDICQDIAADFYVSEEDQNYDQENSKIQGICKYNGF